MIRSEMFQLAVTILGAGATVISGVEAKLIKKFKKQNATSEQHAMTLPRLRTITSWRLSRLKSIGVIVQTSDARYYFIPPQYHAFRVRRRFRVLVLMAILGGVVVLAMVLSK